MYVSNEFWLSDRPTLWIPGDLYFNPNFLSSGKGASISPNVGLSVGLSVTGKSLKCVKLNIFSVCISESGLVSTKIMFNCCHGTTSMTCTASLWIGLRGLVLPLHHSM